MNGTILLVDDEDGIRKVLSLHLREHGFSVLAAGDGREALSIFERERPPFVMTDVKMPGMDGVELLRELKRRDPDVEVIMITGHGDLDLASQAVKLEAADFVVKPVGDDALEIALKRAVERRALKLAVKAHTHSLEALVEERTRELVVAERRAAVGRAAAALSHSIKNIASGLEGAIFFFEQSAKTPDLLGKGVTLLKENAARIKRLALDLIKLGGEHQVRTERADPNKPARDVVDLLAHKALIAGAELVFNPSPLPEAILDADGVGYCLLNLIDNALDAVSTNPVGAPRRVEVCVGLENGLLVYRTSDNGPGLSPAAAAGLFTAYAGDKSPGAEQGGGVGLWSVKKIMDALGGAVSLAKETGLGAVFVLQIPFVQAPFGQTPHSGGEA